MIPYLFEALNIIPLFEIRSTGKLLEKEWSIWKRKKAMFDWIEKGLT
jgi:hypothetical protein